MAAGRRVGLVVVAALVQPGRRVLRVLGVLVFALMGVGRGGVDDALGLGAAFDGGMPRLPRRRTLALLRVDDPEGTEGVEVVRLLAAALGLSRGGGYLPLIRGGCGRRVF